VLYIVRATSSSPLSQTHSLFFFSFADRRCTGQPHRKEKGSCGFCSPPPSLPNYPNARTLCPLDTPAHVPAHTPTPVCLHSACVLGSVSCLRALVGLSIRFVNDPAPRFIPVIAECLRDPHRFVREAAMSSFRDRDWQCKVCISITFRWVSSSTFVAIFLEDVRITIPAIGEFLKDYDSHVRSVVIEHLSRGSAGYVLALLSGGCAQACLQLNFGWTFGSPFLPLSNV